MAELTPSQTVGPFFSFALTADPGGAEVVKPGERGAISIEGTVFDGSGRPVPDAMLETWQPEGFGRAGTDAQGSFRLVTVRPAAGAGAAPYLAMAVFARGLLHHLWTRVYFADEVEANARDPLLASIEDPAVRDSLIASADGDGFRFDVRLQGDHQTCFLAI